MTNTDDTNPYTIDINRQLGIDDKNKKPKGEFSIGFSSTAISFAEEGRTTGNGYGLALGYKGTAGTLPFRANLTHNQQYTFVEGNPDAMLNVTRTALGAGFNLEFGETDINVGIGAGLHRTSMPSPYLNQPEITNNEIFVQPAVEATHRFKEGWSVTAGGALNLDLPNEDKALHEYKFPTQTGDINSGAFYPLSSNTFGGEFKLEIAKKVPLNYGIGKQVSVEAVAGAAITFGGSGVEHTGAVYDPLANSYQTYNNQNLPTNAASIRVGGRVNF